MLSEAEYKRHSKYAGEYPAPQTSPSAHLLVSSGLESALDCSDAVVNAAASLALVTASYKNTGIWSDTTAGSSSPVKRAEPIPYVDEYLSDFPDHIKLYDSKYHGSPLNKTHLPQTLGKRDLDLPESSPWNMYYDGDKPLTFVYHNTKRTKVPVFVATNGTHFHVGHIAEIDESDGLIAERSSVSPLPLPWKHKGQGGVKVQVMSRFPTMTILDVEAYLDTPTNLPSRKPPIQLILDATKRSYMIGFSYTGWVTSRLGHRTSGQWAMEAETKGFGSNFETNWNWCFGVHKTNCDKEL